MTTDGHKAYLEAIEGAFGADIDYAPIIKLYGAAPESAKGRYSPADCTGIRKIRIEGEPDREHVSNSYVERANLTMRMHNRRFTRLTNAFSKKFESHAHMVALYAVWYKLCLHSQEPSCLPSYGGERCRSALVVGRHRGAYGCGCTGSEAARELQEAVGVNGRRWRVAVLHPPIRDKDGAIVPLGIARYSPDRVWKERQICRQLNLFSPLRAALS